MPKSDPTIVKRWNELSLVDLLEVLADNVKRYSTFVPIAISSATRWQLNVKERYFRLLLVGPIFYDTQSKKKVNKQLTSSCIYSVLIF